jgi:hypothetical protein
MRICQGGVGVQELEGSRIIIKCPKGQSVCARAASAAAGGLWASAPFPPLMLLMVHCRGAFGSALFFDYVPVTIFGMRGVTSIKFFWRGSAVGLRCLGQPRPIIRSRNEWLSYPGTMPCYLPFIACSSAECSCTAGARLIWNPPSNIGAFQMSADFRAA